MLKPLKSAKTFFKKIALHIAIAAIMAKMAILAILSMAIGINNMVILGIQIKNIKTTSSVVLNSYKSDPPFRCY